MPIDLYAGLSGRLLATVPMECVRDCSAQGSVDAACAYWARSPQVTFGNLDDIRDDLRECGAWDAEELANDDANRERILFTACGSYAEELKQSQCSVCRSLFQPIDGENACGACEAEFQD